MIEELKEELHKANFEIHRLQESVGSNPKLTETAACQCGRKRGREVEEDVPTGVQ